MSFRGHDYTELFPFLGLGKFDTQDEELAAFKAALAELDWQAGATVEISLIRDYIEAMVACDVGSWGHIWNGLLACEDDYTFMQAVHALAEHMWT